MSSIRAVIFDLDDTLYPERQFTFSGFEAVVTHFAGQLGWGEAQAARMRELFDTPFRARIFDNLLEESGVEPARRADLVQAMVRVHRGHRPRLTLFADAEAALARLHGRVRLGVLSDGFLATQQAKLMALGLHARVDAVVLTDQWGREFWKPHIRGFQTIAQTLGVPPESCAYVADNPAKDFLAPNALGWQTIRILRAGGIYRDEPMPTGGEPQRVITSLDELNP